MPLDTASLKAAIQTSFANQNAGLEQVLATLKRLPSIANAASAGALTHDQPRCKPANGGAGLQVLTKVLHRLDDTTKEAASLKRVCQEALLSQPPAADSTPTKVSIPEVTPPHKSRYESPAGSLPDSPPKQNGHAQDPAEARPIVCSRCQQVQASMPDVVQDLESHQGNSFALATAEEALVAAKAEVVERTAQCEALRAQLAASERALRKLSRLVADAAKERVDVSPRGAEGARQEFVELMELQGLCSAMQLRGSGLQVVKDISSQGAQIDAMLEAALAQVKDLKAEMMMEWDECVLSPADNSLRNEPLNTPSSRSLPDHHYYHSTTARALGHDAPPTPPPFSSAPNTPANTTATHPHHPHPHPHHHHHHHALYQPPDPPFLAQPPHANSHPAANGAAAPPPSTTVPLNEPLEDLTYSLDPVHFTDSLTVDIPLSLESPSLPDEIPQLPPGIPAFHDLPQNFQEMFYHDRVEFFRIIDEFQRMLQANGPPL